MKNWLIIVLLLPFLVACGGTPTADTPAAAPESPVGEEATEEETTEEESAAEESDAMAAGDELEVDRSQLSDELYLFNWSEYMDPEILEEFESEFGVRVIEDFYDANESMLPKIRAGNSGYDIVVPSDYAVEIMVEEELLAPLDHDLLPNLEYIDEGLLDREFDPGNAYTVPFFWGTTGIGYNQNYFDTPPNSWEYLFDTERLEALELSGKFTMLEDPRETPGAALMYLGYPINSTDREALQEAEDLLIEQKPYVAAYDSANVNLKLATEEIVIAHIYDGSVGQARLGIGDKPGNPDISYVIPEEGASVWQDTMAIVAESPNQYTAHVFINFLMRPDIAARNADYVLYLTPNEAARPLLAEETKEVFDIIQPEAAAMDRLQEIRRNEETDLLFTDLWTRVVSQ